jgi:hypothetical protein
MAEALAALPAEPARPDAAGTRIAEPTASQPQPKPEPVAELDPAPESLSPVTGEGGAGEGSAGEAGGIACGGRGDSPGADLVAAAERYAAAYPERAALIRRIGRLPHDVQSFDPPEAALAQTLITARIPTLAALDRKFAEAHAA